jgi:hypothetical protein
VKLLRRDFVSRSEAKRLLANLEKFRAIVLDFRDVKSVGQGFADEVFRVFARSHPGIAMVTENTNPVIDAMIEIAQLAENDPEKLKAAPVTTPVSRPDEVAAAKNLNIACFD